MGDTQVLPTWAILIKRFRGLQQLTQAEFGAQFGVSQVAVAYWEMGKNEPPAEVLMRAMTVTRYKP